MTTSAVAVSEADSDFLLGLLMPKPKRKRSTESARKRPAQRRSRETVRALLEAFTRILIARGYAETTTNEVAKLAGVSIGTLYEYFPHKDALVRELLDAHLAEAEAALVAFDDEQFGRALALPLAMSIEQLVSFSIALHAERPALHRVLFEEASRLASVRKRAGQLEQRLTALVAKLLAEHEHASCSDPELSAYLVVRTVDALVHGWVTRPKSAPLDVTALQREIVRLVLSYVSSPAKAL
jgi:AcrR family transcriptional regulator